LLLAAQIIDLGAQWSERYRKLDLQVARFKRPRRQRPRIKTYKPIIATTVNAITYSILFTSLSIVSTINAGVTPTVAPTNAFLGMKIRITFCCDRNVTGIPGRLLYTRRDTAGIEVFIHR
jgi:hypothetical protein